MEYSAKSPSYPEGPLWRVQCVDSCARRISDPVQKLRFLRRMAECGEPQSPAPTSYRWLIRGVLLLLMVLTFPVDTVSEAGVLLNNTTSRNLLSSGPEDRLPIVWLVEISGGQEIYSNGLRIETRFVVSPSEDQVVPFQRIARETGRLEASPGPAGIVFHSTESLQAPFEEDQNRSLRRIGEALLQYVRQHRCYHFVIDRFGRVFRIVPENERADHAGHSVWADSMWNYVNLNSSFLAVSIEAQTGSPEDRQEITAAQRHSAHVLTHMLRARYRIPASNCVTHAQVSVNPHNSYIGYHTDWAASFPFEALGLKDNYAIPLPSLYVFGFRYDPTFLKMSGANVWKGILLAEERVRQQALAQGRTVAQQREALQGNYRAMFAAVRSAGGATQENH